jgi:hypothetical protein
MADELSRRDFVKQAAALMFVGGSTVPKTFLWAAGPTAASAAYAYRRIIENHFSQGCSTKGFA